MDRSPISNLPPSYLDPIQRGTLTYEWKGILCLKNPFDMALYQLLMGRLKPRTLIEIGSYSGGSAIWFADMARALNIEMGVISIDIKKPIDVSYSGVEYREGAARNLSAVLSDDEMARLPHPFLIIEDSSHNYEDSLGVMRFFDPWLRVGEYICVEDGIMDTFDVQARHNGGPNRAIKEFLIEKNGAYEVDAAYCDYYGYNVTWNTNGYLKKVAASQAEAFPSQATSGREHRYGTGSAKIRSVSIHDSKRRATTELQTRQDYFIILDLVSKSYSGEVVCGVIVRNSKGAEVYGTDSSNQPSPLVICLDRGEEKQVAVRFRNVLSAGDYYLTAGVALPDTTKLDMRFDALQFSVHPKDQETSSSVVDLEMEFRVENA